MTIDPKSPHWRALVCGLVDLAAQAGGADRLSPETLRTVSEELRSCLDAPHPLTRLGLEPHELACVWTLALSHVDWKVARTLAGMDGDRRPSLGTLMQVCEVAGLSGEISGSSTLFRLGILECEDASPDLFSRPKLASDVLAHLLETSPLASEPLATQEPRMADLCIEQHTASELTRAARVRGAVLVVSSMPGSGRRTCVTAAAREAGTQLTHVDARKLARDPMTLRGQLRAVARACRLSGRQPLVTNLDALVDEKGERLELVASDLAALVEGTIFVTTGVHRPKLEWGRPVIVVEMKPPTSAQRAALWSTSLGEGTPEDGEHLAGLYPLAPALVVRAAEAAKAHAGGRALRPDDIYAGVRTVLDDKLGHFAKRLTVTQTWDDIVLPPEQMESIIELVARIRERRTVYEEWGFAAKVGKGLGVSALFSGPPGTGKTMVASLIARELGLEIYQVDLAKVVSKWIGETEKNLAALFDAAEAGHAVLLFDEADALFGKRTDVKSSNDRNANLETNYLLQRLESFTGICLLTSNHESHIDPAFQRRLSLHLRFDVPDLAERAHLWSVMLPAEAPRAPGIDFAALARKYDMTGGYIRNAALRAAFLAANAQTAITGVLLERAARAEYESMGKLAYESTEVVS